MLPANVTTIASRAFGIEIELVGLGTYETTDALAAAGINVRNAGYSHTTTPYWKVVTDASVSGGCEVVSPILRGEEGLAEVRRVCAALEAAGARINKSCGFHVHVDGRSLSLHEVKNVAREWLKNEANFDAMVPPSRRANHYCRSNLAHFASEQHAFERVEAATTMGELIETVCPDQGGIGGRYHKLNLTALHRHGTVEFRQHSGTIDADKATHWITLCVNMVEGVAGKTRKIVLSKPEGRFEMLLTTVPKATKAYLRARRAHFATGADQ